MQGSSKLLKSIYRENIPGGRKYRWFLKVGIILTGLFSSEKGKEG